VAVPELAVAVLAHVLLAIGCFGVVRRRAAVHTRRAKTGHEAALSLRRLRRRSYLFGGLAAIALAVVDGFDGAVRSLLAAVVPSAVGEPSGTATVAVATLLGPVLVVALAVQLAALPYRREARALDLAAHQVVTWFATRLPAPVLAALVATVVVWATPPGWPRVATVVALSAVSMAGLPYLLAYVFRARSPTLDEASAVGSLPDDVALRVIDDGVRVGSVFAAGVLPRARYVFVTAGLFDVLSDDELAAVVAHEVGHHRRGHVVGRYLLVGVPVVALIAAAEFEVPHALLAAAVLVVPYLLAVARVVRWTEFDADAYAARVVGASPMAEALHALARRHLVLSTTGLLASAVSFHPTVAARMGRLYDSVPGAPAGSAAT